MKSSPNNSYSKAPKMDTLAPKWSEVSYGPNIRFGTSINSSPNTFSTDFSDFGFFMPIQITFGSRSDIFAKFSVRNFRNLLQIGLFAQEHSVNFLK